MKSKFLAQLKRYIPTAAQEKALENLVDYKISTDKEKRLLTCAASFSSYVSKKVIFSIEAAIKKVYDLNEVFIKPFYENTPFELRYALDTIETFSRYDGKGVAVGFFSDCGFDFDGERFVIRLRDGLEPSYLYRIKAERFFESCIFSEFGTTVKVIFIGNEKFTFQSAEVAEFEANARKESAARLDALEAEQREAERIKAEKQEREREARENPKDVSFNAEETVSAEPVYDSSNENIFLCGRMKFDISEKETVEGKEIHALPKPIRLREPDKRIAFCCELFKIETKDTQDGSKTRVKLFVTDLDSSIMVKINVEKGAKVASLKAGTALIIEGRVSFDTYEEEYVVRASSIEKIKRINRKDTHPTPRVELHLHTNMSASDGLCDVDKLVSLAESWNMPAIAITDHANLQSYPLLMKATTKKRGGPSTVKPIYGMEGYLVDDTARAVFDYKGTTDTSLSEGTFVLFDIETTGLSPRNCGITQIGGLKYRGGEIIDEFETYVNPGMPIPQNITELTGITDAMVKDAPSEKEAVEAFLRFAGEHMLIAHNSPFDVSFIRRVSDEHKLNFNNPSLDTVSLSRYLNPELSRHRLDTLAEYFKLGDFDHHRATDDTKMLGMIFNCMVEKLQKQGVYTVNEMLQAMEANADPKKIKNIYHITILVKNATGLKNLYKIVSSSYLNSFYYRPRIPKTLINEYRDGLIIGSACERGELYSALVSGEKKYADLLKIADFYDYFEIMPNPVNAHLIEKGIAKDINHLNEVNKQIINIAKKQKKLVVATGDVHFIDPDDSVYRDILLFDQKTAFDEHPAPLYLRTTEEMLEEFAYLGEEQAFEVVVTNTRKIADMIEVVLPIPNGKYTPELPGATEELIQLCYDVAHENFGDPLPKVVEDRLKKELDSIITNGFASLYMIAVKLVKHSEANGYLVGSRGSVGSSVVASFSGISEVNPLPPHYRCPKCKKSIFFTKGEVGSGFDLEDKKCEECGVDMIHDGHDIPFETFLGFKGDKDPDIDLNFSGEIQSTSHKYTEVLFGAQNIFRAGTVSAVAEKTAFGYVKKYLESKGRSISKAEMTRLAAGCTGVKRTTGQHPGGIVVIPKEYDIYDFTAVQYPANKEESGVITTHFAFEYLHDTLLKLDMLGHDVPTLYRKLTDYTGIDVRTVPMNDKNVMELFLSTKPLGVKPEQINSNVGTYGMPECGTPYVRKMLEVARPKCFSDLLQISGLSHGTGIWLGNGEDLINNGTCTISEIIGTRDSIMLYLVQKGVNYSSAFNIMESVRKGKGVSPEYEAEMIEAGVPEWYITSCKKIEYMFPKAHAAAYMIAALRLGWFKVYKPLEFYAAYFTVKQSGFDAELMLEKRNISKAIKELENAPNTTAKEEETLSVLYIVAEMYARGIEFLPVDIFKSDSFAFIPENGKIRLPLSSLNGLGASAAENIHKAVNSGEVMTVDDLKRQASLTKTVMEILKKNNCLGNLPESHQLTLF